MGIRNPPGTFGYFRSVESTAPGWVLKPFSKLTTVYSFREKRAFSETKLLHSQSSSGIFQNPQFQPHILFLLRQKENVPLTVQEKKAAGGAVKGRFALPRTPC